MKKVIILFLLSFLFVVPGHAADKPFLTFSAIQNSVNSTISLLVLREAYAKMGLDIDTKPLPAKRALIHANKGEVDGELFRIGGIEKTNTNLVQVPVAINQLDGMVMTHGEIFEVKGWESLKPYRIAIRLGVKFSEQGTRGMTTKTFNTNKMLGWVLLAEKDQREADISVIARVNGLVVIRDIQNTGKGRGLKLLEPPIESYPLYHYLHKKNEDLVPKLTNVLKDMEASGRIRQIRREYLDRNF